MRAYKLTAIILSLSLTLLLLLTAVIPASAGASQYQRSGLADREPAPMESSRLSLPRSEARYGQRPALTSAMPERSSSSPVIADSRFDLDNEGWTVSANWVGTTYQASGSNPSEYRLGTDSRGLDNLALPADLCPTGDDLIVTSGMTCWLVAGIHTYLSIIIENGGTVLVGSDLIQGTGVSLVADEMRIEVGGLLTADGIGYGSSAGPGSGLYSYDNGASGAGHGGIGGTGNGQPVGGSAYGSVYNPILLGSGGGNRSLEITCGGTGGGAVHLVVGGTLTVDGQLTVSGSAGASGDRGCGGGSGGSLWIEAGTLAGDGQISANGGPGSGSFRLAGGGAGGRIAVDADTTGFVGSIQAYGGSGNQYGGPGTISLAQDNKLVINNDGHDGAAAGLVEGSYDFDTLTLSSYGHLDVLGTGSTLALTNSTVTGDGTAVLTAFGTVSAPASFTIAGYALNVKGELSGVSEASISGDGRLILWAVTPLHSGPYAFSSVSVDPNGALTLVPYDNGDADYTNDSPFELTVTDISVAFGGVIGSNSLGYASQYGPGAGEYSYDSGASGAGHGGIGGAGFGQKVGGSAYGSIYNPILLGSGGGTRYSETWCGGAGGGAIHLIASGVVSIDGQLSADGGSGLPGDRGCGGGSGGSLWIEAGTLAGDGQISANGGSGSGSFLPAGGGAGGRIAVYSESIDPSIAFSVAGASSFQPGGDGTIYLEIRVLSDLPDTGFAPDRITMLDESQRQTYTAISELQLEIPSLGIRIPILGIPSTGNSWDIRWLWNQAGLLEGTAYPGWAGNSVMAGHLYLPSGVPGPFAELRDLRWGDEIIVHAHGLRHTYMVLEREYVLPNDLSVLGHEEYPWLTLITCHDYDEAQGTYNYRFVVRAVKIRVEAE